VHGSDYQWHDALELCCGGRDFWLKDRQIPPDDSGALAVQLQGLVWMSLSMYCERPQLDFYLWLYLLISHDVKGRLGEPERAHGLVG
tara:strand:- start:151 stop:411 length:261 start_codon:yes stop_codon:yes gene_type:complete